MKFKEFDAITRAAFSRWRLHKAPIRASALSFFAIFPLPSLLLILAAILGQFSGQTVALQQVIQQVTFLAGPAIAGLVNQILQSARNPFTSLFVSVISIVFTVVGAAGAFGVLQESMNTIWDTHPPKHRNLAEKARYNLNPVLLISVLAITIFTWTSITNVLFNLIVLIFQASYVISIILQAATLVFGFLLASLLFAIIYKVIPDTKIAWNDVVIASLLTAFLFVLSNYIFRIYVQLFSSTSFFGTAGSLMLLLLWIYLVFQFLLFGAEFSRAYAEVIGSRKKNQTQNQQPIQQTSPQTISKT
jgi:membrane protein